MRLHIKNAWKTNIKTCIKHQKTVKNICDFTKKRLENKHKNVHKTPENMNDIGSKKPKNIWKTPENMNEIGSKNPKNIWKTNMKTFIKHRKTRKKRM